MPHLHSTDQVILATCVSTADHTTSSPVPCNTTRDKCSNTLSLLANSTSESMKDKIGFVSPKSQMQNEKVLNM